MSDYIMSILKEVPLVATLASIFAILVVTILKVIKRAEFFYGKTAVLVAVSLSVLFLVALSQFLVEPPDAHHTPGSGSGVNATTRYFLLPGVALGVAAAVVLSQVLLLASRMPPDEKSEPPAKKPERFMVKPKSPGRLKKAESKRPPVPQKPSGKGKNEAKASGGAAEGAATT